jgi:DnaJ-class molecular chaperone
MKSKSTVLCDKCQGRRVIDGKTCAKCHGAGQIVERVEDGRVRQTLVLNE